MENPFIQAPPRNLKKCFQGVRLVTRAEVVRHVDNYNQWSSRWKAAQSASWEEQVASIDSPHGHIVHDCQGVKGIWSWQPNDGPCHLAADHEFNTQREFPLCIRAKLRNWTSWDFVSPDQIMWAAWVNS